jgi:excinuclease ABC subunit C
MLDERGEVIYVGKAKALKNRVSGYFRGEHEPKTAVMVSKVSDFDVIIAASEFEALVLENSLIKRHQPRYNILLRDDKAYPFVRLDAKSPCPRFGITNRVASDGAKYFGPYGGRSATKELIDTVSKAVGLPSCSRKFPRDFGKGKACLNYHMGACPGWCTGFGDEAVYRERVHSAEMIFGGKCAALKAQLEAAMEKDAEALRFEAAAEKRDRLRALETLDNRQTVLGGGADNVDAVGFFRGVKSCFSVLHYVGGNLVSKDCELTPEPLEDDGEAVSAFVRQFYSIKGLWPKTVLLPVAPEDSESLARFMSQAAGHTVSVLTPQRGEKAELIKRANLNAREESERYTSAEAKRLKTLEWLKDTLGISELPRRIEAFDISNTGSFGMVASMTAFLDGKPYKKGYRRFRIKQLEHQDDYGSMRQALERRFKHLLDGDERFGEKPDLVLLDGGAAHAQSARRVLDELELDIPAVGMVKDDRHRTRELIFPDGRLVGISGNPAAFALIGTIQEETHRFAIEYHRALRKETIVSKLDAIPGVGQTRRNALLNRFKSLKAVSKASLEELSEVVPKSTAQAIFEYFRKDD